MHWHWQNLNERKDGTSGPGIVNGRAWWHFDNRSTVGVQWVFRREFRVGASVQRGGHHAIAGHIHLAWFSLYLHGEGFALRWWPVHDYDGHEYALSFRSGDGWVLSWAWNGDPMSWSNRDPWWKNGQRSLKDVFFGRIKFREGEPETHRIAVVMPEATYTGTCVMRDDSWKRPLWFRQTIRRAHVDMDEGQHVPFPGKGENSWDCGEDGIYGMTCEAATPNDAIAAIRESAEKSRQRYGGRNWKPEGVR